MTDWNGFRGAAKRLDDIDLPRIGHRIGVGEDELHAFMDVEAAGSGFDRSGRPKMLFEPHVFYRNLSGAERDRAVREGLAYRKWGERPYPSDSYDRLERAIVINETAAIKAASWGLTQILAENHSMVGFDTPQAMVQAFMQDEEHHLEAAVQFLIAANIADDLRAHRWAAVARGYNGPGYRKNAYDTKMAAAFAKWRRIPDTPWTPPDKPADVLSPIRAKMVSRGMRGADVSALQERLVLAGHYNGAIDGVFGPMTEDAVKAFQRAAGVLVDGYAGPQTLAALDKALQPETQETDMPATPQNETKAGGPVEKMIGAGKGAAQGAVGGFSMGAGLVVIGTTMGWLPPEANTAIFGASVTGVLTGFASFVMACIGAYRAPRNAE